MEKTSYYQVNVTVFQETEGKNGEIKIKKVQEVYLVRADHPENALASIKTEFSTCPYEWCVKSMKVLKLAGIIE